MERLKLGYLTVCMDIPLEAHVKFAASSGFQALEVAAFKPQSERDFASSTINVIDFLKSPEENAASEPDEPSAAGGVPAEDEAEE